MNDMPVNRELLTVPEVARELRLSLPTVYRRVSSGDLRALRLGEHGPLRIPRDALQEFVQPAAREAA